MPTRRSREARSAVALVPVLAGLLGGCSSEDTASYPRCDYRVCPIDEPLCVEHVASVVGCRMEREPLSVPVRYLTAAEVLAEMQAEAEELTPEQERDQADYLRGEAVVGLMPLGYEPADMLVDTIVHWRAYYSHDDDEIVIITDQTATDEEGEYLLLVHEMVHAYQDAQYDLTSLNNVHATTLDRMLGLKALVEGEAVLHQNLASMELDGFGPDQADWQGYFEDWQAGMLDAAYETDVPRLDALILFPYAFGGELVVDAWRASTDNIARLYATPPDSVRQVMGGFRRWPQQLQNADEAFDPAAIPVLPAAYQLIGGGHESVWLLNAMMQRTASSSLWQPVLDEVSADYLSVFRHDDSAVVVWRVHSAATATLRDELLQSQLTFWVDSADGEPSSHVVSSIDSDLLLVAVSHGDAGAVVADIQGWQSPQDAYADPGDNAASRWRFADFGRLLCSGRLR